MIEELRVLLEDLEMDPYLQKRLVATLQRRRQCAEPSVIVVVMDAGPSRGQRFAKLLNRMLRETLAGEREGFCVKGGKKARDYERAAAS